MFDIEPQPGSPILKAEKERHIKERENAKQLIQSYNEVVIAARKILVGIGDPRDITPEDAKKYLNGLIEKKNTRIGELTDG